MSQEQLPRIDSENSLGLNFHAPRALRRFEGITDTEARRVAVGESKFRNLGTHKRESGEMRLRLLQMIDRIEGKLIPDQLKLYELVSTQFAGELALYKENGLYDADHPNERDVPAPDAATAFQVLFAKLSSEQIAEILKRAKQPQFQLEAVTSFKRYIAALNAHPKMPRQIDAYVNPKLRAAWAAQDAAFGIGDNIVGWNVGIIEAAQELEADPELSGNLGQQLTQAEAKLSAAGLRLPHPRRYALAQMRALKQGKPLDVVNWSALNSDKGDRSVIPRGRWFVNQVVFFEVLPDNQHESVRFRPEVVAKVA